MNIPQSVCFKRPESDAGWRAELRLKYGIKREKTRLLERHQIGPLTVQKTFFPEGAACHTYLLHPPGGVVGGDQLSFTVDVEEQAHALLTTPGATKFYRSNAEQAWQSQQLSVAASGLLEWLPMENIFFPGANCKLLTQVNLTANARFIGWEMQCFGRPQLGEEFNYGQVLGQTFICRDNKVLLTESLRVQDQFQFKQAAAMRNFAMTGSLYITPVDRELIDKVNQVIDKQQARFATEIVLGSSELGSSSMSSAMTLNSPAENSLLVVRALGHQTEPMMASFVQIWRCVRQHWFGQLPDVPRIWST
ncbi:urease accessory protein UreD [Shewanella schlegeliana]|uniref:Urease accessory protein UreD n=1 Tax=Shewanella schlegeliana TaxID=190308 RepID=A0ABS1SYK8_9GAMM|nr:urease accessory protein UreD [Shewanella schlegeliana]MBL4912617.1 urease accessory protein UreD [Shewanella schlegeliana]MCL1109875.1 urease accessory protein UreD [Shewanella schlegeliana]GIU32641.1 urease accessory protein UreD [Shewanella schlegeliana]